MQKWVTLFTCVVMAKKTMLDSLIYDHITAQDQAMSFCFRRLNQTHQVGCQTSTDPGDIGTLMYIQTSTELSNLLLSKEKSQYGPFAIIMEIGLLNEPNVKTLLLAQSRVSTVITYRNESEELTYYSPDYKCPRQGFSNKKCEHNWNPNGSGIMWEDYPFGVLFYKNTSIIETMKDYYYKYNVELGYPVAQYQAAVRMLAAENTPTCIRRSLKTDIVGNPGLILCDRYGGHNVLYTAPTLPEAKDAHDKIYDNSMVLLISKMDHISFFQNTGRGSISQMILLAISKALAKSDVQSELKKNNRSVGILFLASEDLGNIGSDSLLYTMSNDAYPGKYMPTDENISASGEEESNIRYINPQKINLSSIKAIIELGELMDVVNNHNIFLHAAEMVPKDIFDTFKHFSSQITVEEATSGLGLPPSSISRLSEESFGGDPLKPTAFLADFNGEYKSNFSNSMFNDNFNFGFSSNYCQSLESAGEGQSLANLGELVTKSILSLALDDKNNSILDEIKIEPQTIQELVCCFLISPEKCSEISDLLNITYNRYDGRPIPAENRPDFVFNPHIVRTKEGKVATKLESLAFVNTLVYYTGEQITCSNETDCTQICKDAQSGPDPKNPIYDNINHYSVLNNLTMCIRSSIYTNPAQSPAFQISDYNLKENPNNYSMWSESEWSYLSSSRIFLIQSPVTQNISLSLGLISLFFAFLISWTMKWKTSSIFVSGDGITNPVSIVGSS